MADITQIVNENLRSATDHNIRVTETVIEVAKSSITSGNIRVTQCVIELIRQNTSVNLRATQAVIELLKGNPAAHGSWDLEEA